MFTRTRTLRALVVAALLAPMLATPAQGAVAIVTTDEDAIDKLLDRGTDPANWMPVLDGQVYVAANTGAIVVTLSPSAGDEPLEPPVRWNTQVGSHCVRTGTWYVEIYLDECLQR